MIDSFGPARIRALTERLIAAPSASPDPVAETACARVLAAALPESLERGEWLTSDGRPVVWAYRPGRTRRVTVVLGHYDTVGIPEFGRLGPDGPALAQRPDALAARLLADADRLGADARQRADLDEERARPGTWMFGRGALDMKSGLAAGVAALAALAATPEPPACGALFVACPDEEVGSAGMRVAVAALPAWTAARGLELAGVLNLDFSEDPVAYLGAMGKRRALLWVSGLPTHVGAPFAGVDATHVAAELAAHAAADARLADRAGGRAGPPAVALRVEPRKPAYDATTATRATVELNLLTLASPIEGTLARLVEVVRDSIDALAGRMHALHGALGSDGPLVWPREASGWSVVTLADLAADPAAPSAAPHTADPQMVAAPELAVREIERRVVASGLAPPAVVIALLPPHYPHVAPGAGPFTRSIAAALAAGGVGARAYYPFVTDASLAAVRRDELATLRRHIPAILHGPWTDPPSLALEIVNLGPWGSDAHGLFERVRADWAFERLPGLIANALRAAS